MAWVEIPVGQLDGHNGNHDNHRGHAANSAGESFDQSLREFPRCGQKWECAELDRIVFVVWSFLSFYWRMALGVILENF